MAVLNKVTKPNAAPALFRLLAESALSRASLGACGFPLAILEASATSRPVTFVNPAFEAFFGYRPAEAIGRPLAALVFRGDDALLHRLLAEPASRWELKTWDKDGGARLVELSLGAVRSAEGRLTHWVAAFTDRSEIERLRAELTALKSLASAP
ncbi:MAG TPA: PAS domain-containing protein [Burkholderiales bacterium]|nr:PAS domain-containing protein [Burkholderiales bacterium]